MRVEQQLEEKKTNTVERGSKGSGLTRTRCGPLESGPASRSLLSVSLHLSLCTLLLMSVLCCAVLSVECVGPLCCCGGPVLGDDASGLCALRRVKGQHWSSAWHAYAMPQEAKGTVGFNTLPSSVQ